MTTEQVRLARRAALDKVIDTFTKGPRSLDPEGAHCVYAGIYKEAGKPPVKTGCAIGIFLSRTLGTSLDGFTDSSVQNDNVFAELPPKVQALGQSFLSKLQQLHDNCLNWENGRGNPAGPLSSEGERRVALIRKEYNL